MMLRCVLILICIGLTVCTADEKAVRKGGLRQPAQMSKCCDVPAHPFDLILNRPAPDSVTVSVMCYEDAEGFIAYGTESGNLKFKTPARPFRKGEPAEIVLTALQPDTRYFYRLNLTNINSGEFTFHTARPPDSSFTFTLTADSHLDERTNAFLYQGTLTRALTDSPDFHIDLGDTFMTEKHENRAAAAKQYLAQRYYFSQLCHSAPLFLALGNHDGESPRGRGGEDESLAVWSNAMRKLYFPNPVPDSFYTGSKTKHPEAGLLQDYYAWEWGDALFVVLDPFWFIQKCRGKGDNWKRTLGEEQYQWLRRTLETSKSKFKFVFIHHLAGGADDQGRGGAEAAPFFEWGGRNAEGSDGFTANRPGWSTPVHQLLVQNHVSIVFHGHDHLYAKQDFDGIVYQEVPQPGTCNNGSTHRSAAEYGYRNGVIIEGSGYMRVTVSSDKIIAEYISINVMEDDNASQISHSYTINGPSCLNNQTVRKKNLTGNQQINKQ